MRLIDNSKGNAARIENEDRRNRLFSLGKLKPNRKKDREFRKRTQEVPRFIKRHGGNTSPRMNIWKKVKTPSDILAIQRAVAKRARKKAIK